MKKSPQCRAKSKRSGKRCKNRAVIGRNVCRMHGGKTPRGKNSPHFKTGANSKDLPTRLQAQYDRLKDHPDLQNFIDDIALAQLRVSELLAGLDVDGQTQLWKDLNRSCNELEKHTNSSKYDQVRDAIQKIFELVRRGYSDQAKWAEIFHVQDHKRKLVLTHRRIQHDAQQLISIEKLILNIAVTTDIIRKYVTDPDTLRAIADDLDRQIISGYE